MFSWWVDIEMGTVQPFFTEQVLLNEQKNQGKSSEFFKLSLSFIFLFPFYFSLLGFVLSFPGTAVQASGSYQEQMMP
jgi:hypothetical protein